MTSRTKITCGIHAKYQHTPFYHQLVSKTNAYCSWHIVEPSSAHLMDIDFDIHNKRCIHLEIQSHQSLSVLTQHVENMKHSCIYLVFISGHEKHPELQELLVRMLASGIRSILVPASSRQGEAQESLVILIQCWIQYIVNQMESGQTVAFQPSVSFKGHDLKLLQCLPDTDEEPLSDPQKQELLQAFGSLRQLVNATQEVRRLVEINDIFIR